MSDTAKPASKPRTPKTKPAEPALSREIVLSAALALIDRNGVAKFSVRDLAKDLNVYPTALYWYVPGRNALVAGAAAMAIGDLPLPRPGHDWQGELVALFHCYRRAVQAHPHIAPVLGAQLVSNESMSLALVERLLALLEAAGFAQAQLRQAFNVVIAAMVGFVTMELAPLPEDKPQEWASTHRERLEHLDGQSYPTLQRHSPELANRAFVLRWSSGSDHPLDDDFDAWCEVIVSGLARLLAKSAKQDQMPA